MFSEAGHIVLKVSKSSPTTVYCFLSWNRVFFQGNNSFSQENAAPPQTMLTRILHIKHLCLDKQNSDVNFIYRRNGKAWKSYLSIAYVVPHLVNSLPFYKTLLLEDFGDKSLRSLEGTEYIQVSEQNIIFHTYFPKGKWFGMKQFF